MVTSLKEFENYIKANYLGSLSVMRDLLTDVFKGQKPTNIEESSSQITEVLNIIRMCKANNMYNKISEEYIEKFLFIV